jgi:LPXTG-site transpeptidase (sortase) family protein
MFAWHADVSQTIIDTGRSTTHMASDDTLNIGSIKIKKDYPARPQYTAGQPQPTHMPTTSTAPPAIDNYAAEAARQRIANLPDAGALLQGQAIGIAPADQLITDKAALAHKAHHGKIPGATKPPKERKMPTALRPMLTAAGIFVIVLLLFKAPILLSQIGYSLGNGQNNPTASTAPAVTDTVPAANTISIPKINVNAPVQYEPSIQEAAVQKALQDGVVHYGNTAFPGQVGNTAIFGHSSNDWWEPGNYKFVFVLLDKLVPGDKITIDYNQHRYTYEVTGSKVVEPTDVAVLNKTTEPTLTLITCSPPGTSLKRLVVTAKQVDPDPSTASSGAVQPAASATNAPSSLSGSSSGFFTQVGQAWNGVVSSFKSLFGGSDSSAPSGSPESSPDQIPAIK